MQPSSTHPPRAPPPDAGRCWPVISALARLLLLILSPLAHLLPIRLLTTVGAVSTGSDGVLNVSHPSFLITPNPAPRSPQAGRTLSQTGLDEAYRHPVPSAPFTLSSTTATKSCTRRCIPTLLVSLPALPTSPLPQPRASTSGADVQSSVVLYRSCTITSSQPAATRLNSTLSPRAAPSFVIARSGIRAFPAVLAIH